MFTERKSQIPSCGVVGCDCMMGIVLFSRERDTFVDSESQTLAGLQVPLCFALWLLGCHPFVGDGKHSYSYVMKRR